MAGERSEQASPRRRQKAIEEGDRPRSRELLAASATLAGTAAFGWAAPGWVTGWRTALEGSLRLGQTAGWRNGDGVAAVLDLRSLAVTAMLPLVAVLACCAGAALVAGIGQGGGVSVHFPVLQPKWSRVDPISNLKNLFSLRAGARLGKTLVPVAVLGLLAWWKLMRQAEIPVFSVARLPGVFGDAYDLLVDAAWILFVWSALDYAVEWRSWNERIKMSKQELREEYKETEGNPQVRGRIRSLQRQMRARMLRGEVAKASVVITNPTHYAVALGFDFETMDAPKVLAKGRNLLAEQIKDEARWAGVPIVENPPLARSLYRTVEVGRSIPFELYAVVAGILAYLYRQQVEERVRRQAAEAQSAAAAAASARTASTKAPSTQAPATKAGATKTPVSSDAAPDGAPAASKAGCSATGGGEPHVAEAKTAGPDADPPSHSTVKPGTETGREEGTNSEEAR